MGTAATGLMEVVFGIVGRSGAFNFRVAAQSKAEPPLRAIAP